MDKIIPVFIALVSSTAISGVPSLISTDIFGLRKGFNLSTFGVPGIIIIEGTWRLDDGWRTLQPRNFQPQTSTPEFSTPDFSAMNLSTQTIMNRVLKSQNLKVGVEKSGFKLKTFQPPPHSDLGLKGSWLKSLGLKSLESGHFKFKPGFLNPNL